MGIMGKNHFYNLNTSNYKKSLDKVKNEFAEDIFDKDENSTSVMSKELGNKGESMVKPFERKTKDRN